MSQLILFYSVNTRGYGGHSIQKYTNKDLSQNPIKFAHVKGHIFDNSGTYPLSCTWAGGSLK